MRLRRICSPPVHRPLQGLCYSQRLAVDLAVGAEVGTSAATIPHAAVDKIGRQYVAAVPAELTLYIDGWLQVHRPAIQLIGTRKGRVGGVAATSGSTALVGRCAARRSGTRSRPAPRRLSARRS